MPASVQRKVASQDQGSLSQQLGQGQVCAPQSQSLWMTPSRALETASPHGSRATLRNIGSFAGSHLLNLPAVTKCSPRPGDGHSTRHDGVLVAPLKTAAKSSSCRPSGMPCEQPYKLPCCVQHKTAGPSASRISCKVCTSPVCLSSLWRTLTNSVLVGDASVPRLLLRHRLPSLSSSPWKGS